MFHLGWFVAHGFAVQSWNNKSYNRTWSGIGAQEWTKPDLYVDMARSMERAGFDYMMIEDSSCVADTFGGTMESVLKNAHGAPKHDPMTLVPYITQATSRLGVVVTAATTFYPPYLLARLMSSLDHLSDGRVGVNLVTASNPRAAQNYGYEQHVEHDLRYKMADEWIEVVTRLWDSWEPDAVVLDEQNGVFADYTKVHTIDYKGEFYSCRGPLQTISSPQGRPVICQAGGSEVGRNFAAKWADTIVAGPTGRGSGAEAMKEYRADITARMEQAGRKPSDCKVLYLVMPVLGESEEEARDKHQRLVKAREDDVEHALQTMSYASGIDFSKFPLDEPLPAVDTQGHQSVLADFAKRGKGKTLREQATYRHRETIDLIGTPDSVAAQMGEAMEEAGGDGFLISNDLDRRTIAEICDGLVPALRRRGLTRNGYTHEHLRDNLLEF